MNRIHQKQSSPVGLFNRPLMNDSVLKFRSYENHSLSYTGINKHQGENVGGFDTTISAKEHQAMFGNIAPT